MKLRRRQDETEKETAKEMDTDVFVFRACCCMAAAVLLDGTKFSDGDEPDL